jgi:hypothetical protein
MNSHPMVRGVLTELYGWYPFTPDPAGDNMRALVRLRDFFQSGQIPYTGMARWNVIRSSARLG